MTREEAIDWLARLKSNTVNHTLEMPLWWNEPLAEALDLAIKTLEQEPCCNCIEFKRYAKEMGFEIEQEPKTGHWKYFQNEKGDWMNVCSNCNSDCGVGYPYNYCPNCGCRMER